MKSKFIIYFFCLISIVNTNADTWETFTPKAVADESGLVGTHSIVIGVLGDPIESCGSLRITTGASTVTNVPDNEYGAAAVNRAFSLALATLARGKDITVLKISGQCYFKFIQTAPD